jgi:hypothetical protein
MKTEIVPGAVLSTNELIERRKQFEEFVKACMIPGIDYEKSTKKDGKDVLLQPGAEKINKFYGLTASLTLVKEVEDWDKPFFYYQYKGQLIWRREISEGVFENMVMADCFGSCNSRESKYAWRWMTWEEIPQELRTLAKKGNYKTETREKWIVEFELTPADKKLAHKKGAEWKKDIRESKAGRKFEWFLHPGKTMYRIPNDDIYDQVNTILKIAGKRAFVGVTIRGTNASALFTQDEDVPIVEDKEDKKPEGTEPVEAGSMDEATKKSMRDNFAELMGVAKTLDDVNRARKNLPPEMNNDTEIYSLYAVRYKEISKENK